MNLALHFALFLFARLCYSQATISQVAGASPDPSYPTLMKGRYPPVYVAKTTPTLSSTSVLLIYMRLIRKGSIGVSTYTSAFYPRVSDYSQMTVPNSMLID